MISTAKLKKYCKDYKLIENYEKALNDNTEIWEIHHRDEDLGYSRKYLIENNMYYDVKPEKLIFLTKAQHRKIHLKDTFLSNPCIMYKEDNPMYKALDKDILYQLRVVERKSLDDIAKILNTCRRTVSKRLKEYNIEEVKCITKYDKEKRKQLNKRYSEERLGENNPNYSNVDINEIEKLYQSGLPMTKIAEILGCSSSTIKRRIIKYNIKKRVN